jgi:hypothetical protein
VGNSGSTCSEEGVGTMERGAAEGGGMEITATVPTDGGDGGTRSRVRSNEWWTVSSGPVSSRVYCQS